MKKNKTTAAKWFQKSAELGNQSASYNLSAMYKNGTGIKKSKAQADKWLRIGEKQQYTPHPDPEVSHFKIAQNDTFKNDVVQNGHSHNGRYHKHPLPKQGIKHRHGNGAYGTATSGGEERKLTSNVISHPNPSTGKPRGQNRWTSYNQIWCMSS